MHLINLREESSFYLLSSLLKMLLPEKFLLLSSLLSEKLLLFDLFLFSLLALFLYYFGLLDGDLDLFLPEKLLLFLLRLLRLFSLLPLNLLCSLGRGFS